MSIEISSIRHFRSRCDRYASAGSGATTAQWLDAIGPTAQEAKLEAGAHPVQLSTGDYIHFMRYVHPFTQTILIPTFHFPSALTFSVFFFFSQYEFDVPA